MAVFGPRAAILWFDVVWKPPAQVLKPSLVNGYDNISKKSVWNRPLAYLEDGDLYMDETPLIQQYLQLRSEFMGYLYAMTRDAELAEEIYQNAAVVVIEKAEMPETIRNVRAWAKEVVRRQALYAIRAKEVSARHGRAMAPELLDAVSDAFVEDTSEDSVVHDEAVALRLCLAGLPTDKRELVAMRYERSSSFDEISRQTGATPAAVQRALSRIRKALHGCVRRRIELAEGVS